MGLGLAWGGILVACTVLNAAAAVLLARASIPQRVNARLLRVQSEVDIALRVIEDYGRQHTANEATIRSLVEEAESAFDRAERKRASAASTLSRRGGGPQEPPRTREELLNRLRSKAG